MMERIRKRRIGAAFTGFAILAAVAGLALGLGGSPADEEDPIVETVNGHEVRITPSGRRYVVDPDKLIGGGPAPDGIPSIDAPRYVSVEEAEAWIDDDEEVLALEVNGVVRAYPHQVLVWHEIVNDTIAGKPVAVTYCPLCGSGIAYERRLDGEPVEFGTSGKLYNSNLVMYDRTTGSYWTQIDGVSIVGELAGRELMPVSIDTVVWGEWKRFHPEAEVLSRETGFSRAYGSDPYAGYDESERLWFPVEARDDRIHPKAVVFGVEVDGVHLAFREDALLERLVLEHEVEGVPIVASRAHDGTVTVIREDTGNEVIKQRVFWFSWYAFHPDTRLVPPANDG